jgi:hypothetical protein
MNDNPLKSTVEALAALEADLTESLKATASRLQKVKAARAILESVNDPDPVMFEGKLADACRLILKSDPRSWTPSEIREQLKVIGYDASGHTNLLASIHSVMKRIKASGDANSKEAEDGSGTTYWWIGPKEADTKPVRRGGHAVPLSTILDANALSRLVGDTESINRLVDRLALTPAAIERALGIHDLKKFQEQIAGTAMALEKLGLQPPKKK